MTDQKERRVRLRRDAADEESKGNDRSVAGGAARGKIVEVA
jgi:hypothetical protein